MSPPPGPGTPHGRLPVHASDLLLVLIVTLGSARLVAVLFGGLLRPADGDLERSHDQVLIVTLSLLVFQALVMLGAVRAIVLRKYGLTWSDLGLRPAAARWYGRAAGIAILLLPVVAMVNAQIPRFAGEPFQNPQIYAIAPVGFGWPALIGMIAVAGVIAPFAEEVAFRGVLYPWLRERFGVGGGAVLSALCFALLHGILWLVPALTVIGVALALIYEKSDSLWPAVVTHGVFNSIMIAIVYAAMAGGMDVR